MNIGGIFHPIKKLSLPFQEMIVNPYNFSISGTAFSSAYKLFSKAGSKYLMLQRPNNATLAEIRNERKWQLGPRLSTL